MLMLKQRENVPAARLLYVMTKQKGCRWQALLFQHTKRVASGRSFGLRCQIP